MKIIKKEDNRTIEERLHDICDSEHSSCNVLCPVYRYGGYSEGCRYFKNGKAMRKYLEGLRDSDVEGVLEV